MQLLKALLIGTALGVFYFWGLWLTVKRLSGSPRPMLIAALSFVGRAVVVLAGFFFAAGGHWERLLAAMLGFFIIRCISVRIVRPDNSAASRTCTTQ